MTNPLLDEWTDQFEMPPFSQIKNAHFEEAFNFAMAEAKINYKKIYSKEFEVNVILDKLNEYLCTHIENQINAGSDVVQIFDSWAGLLFEKDLPNYCYIPNLKIVEFCKSKKIYF